MTVRQYILLMIAFVLIYQLVSMIIHRRLMTRLNEQLSISKGWLCLSQCPDSCLAIWMEEAVWPRP